ncbi:MAG: YdeI/OmpD-associated family protein [Flavobacteriales bacterium]|nr:YdeI/OmpD-associated family protein [Flavobacteriales bacterium]
MVITEQINQYIAENPEWQRKLLVRLRQLIHSTDAEVEETWKWNSPHFDHQGIMIGLQAFKEHIAVWFHKGALIKDPKKLFEKLPKGEEKGMRSYKLHEGDTINEAAFVDLVKQAVALNVKGTKLTDAKPAKKALVLPEDLGSVLHKDPTAWANWEAFSYSHKKEYIEWVTDAKQEETRKRRIAQALEKIREGESKEEKHQVH